MEHHLLTWRAACTPHRDIREDAVSEALFAVNLSRAIAHEGPEEYAERQEMARLLQAGIETLPPNQRITLALSDVQGLSYQEIAEATDVPLGTVRSRLARARGKLRDYLRTHGELLPAQYRLE